MKSIKLRELLDEDLTTMNLEKLKMLVLFLQNLIEKREQHKEK